METHEKVRKWAKSLGYTGEVPDSFKSICGPSTSFIWEQLMAKVKPKQEVERIRYTNLMARLQTKKKSQSLGKATYPIKELELWKRKNELKQRIAEVEQSIKEKEKNLKTISNKRKITAMQIGNIKETIEENDSKAFLLKQKSDMFQKEVAQVEEAVDFLKTTTPIESTDEESNVAETLTKCVEKIEMTFMENQLQAPTCTKSDLTFTPQKTLFTSIFSQSDYSMEDCQQSEEYKTEIAKEIKCLDNDDLSKDIKGVLYNTTAQSILNVILNDIEVLKRKLFNVIQSSNINKRPMDEENVTDSMMELHQIQIENELYAIKYTKEIEKLKRQLEEKEKDVNVHFERLNMPASQIADVKDFCLLRRKQAGLTARCECVSRQLSDCQSVKGAWNELNRMKMNSLKSQEKLVENLRNLNHTYEIYKKMYKTMLWYRGDTKVLVKKLDHFINDLDWTLPLINNVNTEEIRIFMEFPLEYNRKINASDSNLFVRDIMNNINIDVESIDSETLHLLLALIECPYSAPEILFQKLWEKKMWVQTEKSLKRTIKSFEYEKYTLEDLQKQESFIDCAVSKLNELVIKNTIKSSEKDVNTMREIARIWLEMPFANYLHKKRLYEGKDVTFYQTKYNSFYDKMEK